MFRVVPDVMIYCPMLKQKIPETMCFEINLVVDEVAIPSFAKEVKDWDKANEMCPTCEVSYYKDVRDFHKEAVV